MDESKLSGITNVLLRKNGAVAEFTYHNAWCFKISTPDIGPAQAICYDLVALLEGCRYIEEHKIRNPIIYYGLLDWSVYGLFLPQDP